jgi:predicted acylesterase/phospholipase RssA
MGITIVRKSGKKVGKGAKKALILAGGAVTGAAFKAGGLRALDEYFTNFNVNRFDVYVGISSGSFIAAPIAAGIPPSEVLKSLDGRSKYYTQLAPWHYYQPNWKELLLRPLNYMMEQVMFIPRALKDILSGFGEFGPQLAAEVWRLVLDPSRDHYEDMMQTVTRAVATRPMPSLLQLLPSGLFDNSGIETYLRTNITRNHLSNSFQKMEKLTGKKLYICAMTLDKAERVIFGPDEKSDVTISEAVQASTAMPGFYKPARIHGVDYVDGNVLETAHFDVAVSHGAELIVCYNPFRPVDNKVMLQFLREKNEFVSEGRRLADNGVMTVLSQIFRTVFHTRLHHMIEQYAYDPHFTGDIVLIEPSASDMAFFDLNPLLFSNRLKAARLGFESVRNSVSDRYDDIEKIFKKYGVRMNRRAIEVDVKRLKVAGGDMKQLRAVLEAPRGH